MTLKNGEHKMLLEVLNDTKPYMVETESIDKLVQQLLESANSIDDYIKGIQNAHDTSKDSILRTDLRIYIGRIRKRVRNHSV